MDAEILGSIAERALDWIHSFLTPSVPHLIQLQSYNMPRKLYFKEHLGLHNCFITEIYSWHFQNKPQAVSSDMLHLFFKREIAISSVSQGQSFRVNHTPYLVHVDQMTSFRFALEDEEYSPFPGSNYLSFSLSAILFPFNIHLLRLDLIYSLKVTFKGRPSSRDLTT